MICGVKELYFLDNAIFNKRFRLLNVPKISVFIIVREKGHGARDVLEKVSLTLIASGGAGNIIDRLLFGQVTDMISFSIFPPVFNVADIAVTCGCGLFVLSLLVDERKEGSK